jgi:hypothetical protein
MEMFKTLVWAGVHDLHLSFDDSEEHRLITGFNQMKEQHPDLSEHTDQFIVRFVKVHLIIHSITNIG